jgi:hypothetical protein
MTYVVLGILIFLYTAMIVTVLSFLTARRNVVPRAVYVIAQIPGGRAGGRTETKLSSSNSAKTVRDRRLVSMEH